MENADLPEEGRTLRVQVAVSPQARMVESHWLRLPEGATLGDALRLSGVTERLGMALGTEWQAGIWTKPAPLDAPLRDLDRVEVWRPLKVDPKEARRQRYRKQSTPTKRPSR